MLNMPLKDYMSKLNEMFVFYKNDKKRLNNIDLKFLKNVPFTEPIIRTFIENEYSKKEIYEYGFINRQCVYTRISNLKFLDDRFKQEDNSIIYLYKFKSNINNNTMRDYSASTIYAINQIKSNVLLDLGSADGILSLVSNKNNNTKCINVEYDKNWKYLFKQHVKTNEININDFLYLNEDINKNKLKDKIPKNDIDTVVANIGPHYDKTHINAIRQLEHLPNVNTFIGGGYVKYFPKDINDILQATKAYEELKKFGFNNITEIYGPMYYPNNFFKTMSLLSFIAKKN
ncbi:MAG: hypothetical protein ACLFPJ_04460 [Candidatus Woesearchaeota archaeon]